MNSIWNYQDERGLFLQDTEGYEKIHNEGKGGFYIVNAFLIFLFSGGFIALLGWFLYRWFGR